MESAEVDPQEIENAMILSTNDHIRGKLHIVDINKIEIDGKCLTNIPIPIQELGFDSVGYFSNFSLAPRFRVYKH